MSARVAAITKAWDRDLLLFAVGVLGLEIGTFLLIYLSDASVDPSYFATLFSAKITFVSLLTAVLTFLLRAFWDEAKSPPPTDNHSGPGGIRRGYTPLALVVSRYRFYFLFLFAAIISAFAAIWADFAEALGTHSEILQSLSISAIGSGFLLLMVFVVYFVGKTLAEMGSVLRADS